jgi:hypothetical protein
MLRHARLALRSLEIAMDQLLSSQPLEDSSSSFLPPHRISAPRTHAWAQRLQAQAAPAGRPNQATHIDQPVAGDNYAWIVRAFDATSPVASALRLDAFDLTRPPEASSSHLRLMSEPPVPLSNTGPAPGQVSTQFHGRRQVEVKP